jgi:hypothetical protein
MLLDDVATYLEAQSTRLTIGVNLTKSFQPDTPSTVTTLLETGGLFPLHAFTTGSGTRYYEQPTLQVLSRSTDYQTVRATIESVFTILDGVNNTNLPTSTGVRYAAIDAIQSPFSIGRDSNDRFEMSVNFTIMKSTG